MVLSDRAARYIKRDVDETFELLTTGHNSVASITEAALEEAHAENSRLCLLIREAHDNGLQLIEVHERIKTNAAA
jgi:hypothetical protein